MRIKTSIWRQNVNPELLNSMCKGTFAELLGLKVKRCGKDYLVAEMKIHDSHKQIRGIMHGGVSCAIAETLGSIAGCSVVNEDKTCVGLEINANHLRPVYDGKVKAITRPLHIGRTTHVWNILLYQKPHRLVNITRLTLAIIDK